MTMADATVLVVDDEPELLEIFSIWLKRYGAAVLKASNGEEALKLLTSHKIDILVSDMRMPVMDGVTLVRNLHALKLSLPTIIFVSGFGDVSNRTLYSLGVEAMLPKPLARQQLLSTLEGSLRKPEERWLEPLPLPAEHAIALEFSDLESARSEHGLQFGRGGCRITLPREVPAGPVDLHLSFTQEGLALKGQGILRWYDPHTKRAGLEFAYLDPDIRPWVLEQIRSPEVQSFIPA